MKDEDKTKAQLKSELAGLRQQITELNTELKVSEAKHEQAKKAARDGWAYAAGIMDTVREPLVVLDTNLQIISANQSFYQTFHISPKGTKNKPIYGLEGHQGHIPELRKSLKEILSKDIRLRDFKVDCEFPGIGRKTMLLNGRRICQESNRMQMIILAFEDITKHKQVK